MLQIVMPPRPLEVQHVLPLLQQPLMLEQLLLPPLLLPPE